MAALPEFGQGRCINCGYLGLLDAGASGSDFYEAGILQRQDGSVDYATGPVQATDRRMEVRANIPTIPVCFRGEEQLLEEIDEEKEKLPPGDHHGDESAEKVFRKERSCPKWTEWIEGFGPQWHYERDKMLELEDRRKKWEEKTEAARKRFDLKVTLTFVSLTVVEIVVAVVAILVALSLKD